jgi:hypothetical protein
MYTSTFRAPARATSITPIQKCTLYFCGPKVGSASYASPLPQSYLAGPMAECVANTANKSASTAAKSSFKDPPTSATVDMSSSVTEDVRKLEEELEREKPITTAWLHWEGRKKV